jgi:HD superfamily phosphohydrolase YqeK
MDISSNFEQINKELLDTQREGVNKLVAYLETTDFKTAPASTKYHLCVEGGLAQHSLNVLRFARLLNKELELNIEDASVVLSAILHDLCKADTYVMGEEWDKEHKDKTGQWRKKSVWKIEDPLPLGHGEKSAIIASKFVDLKPEETIAIRWHMLKWDVSDAQKFTLQDAMEQHSLLKIIALADQMAELYETMGEKGKEG